MKRFVLIILLFFSYMTTGCLKEEQTISEVSSDDLVDAYVQISLINESDMSEVDKKRAVDLYLADNYLSDAKIEKYFERYRSDPIEWRGFFMEVQKQLRELEAEQRAILIKEEEEAMKIDEEEAKIDTVFPLPLDTVIIDSIKLDFATAESDSPSSIEDSIPYVDTEPQEVIPEAALIQSGIGVFSYTVKSGDNLSSLASDYDSELKQLLLINVIDNPNSIRIGQKLFIPNPETEIILHTISPGEALSKISTNYDSDLDEIIKINKIENINSINAGDLLYVPVLKKMRKDENERNTFK
ncbi:MAG: LysM peptidoglycan-binding domain-containing protein [Candidatus Marinimicrobia bacterium]|nr:LysM peptidoglycan-binding domain-containing protein [Candidatus Neomarinimicrobiota bacterium]